MRHVVFTLDPQVPERDALHTVERFAVPLSQVRTVVMPRPLSRVPRAPAPLLGIMNLRGRVVSVVALAGLLGASGLGVGKVLLLDRGRTDLGLGVGEVLGITPLEAQLRAPDGAPPFVSGVAQDDRGTVTLLDANALDAQVAALFSPGELG